MDVDVKNLHVSLKAKELLAGMLNKSFGFCMIRKPKYRGKLRGMLNCIQFLEIKGAKIEIVTNKENQINNSLQQ